MRLYFQLLLWLESVIAVLAYLTTASLLVSVILSREVFTTSIDGAQKVAVLAAILAGSLGMAIATGENAHLRPTFADTFLPGPVVDRIGDVLSAAIYAGLR